VQLKRLTFAFVATLGTLLGAGPSSAAADKAPAALFPFALPADDVTEGVTDLSFLNATPANEPVSVRDGHFVVGDRRVRFWSAIIIGGACFPTHDDAVLVARRLASRGFNQVRIHLIDGHCAPNGLFDPQFKGELRIDPGQLERLDFLIAQLKSRGLYVELPINGYHWRNILGPAEYPAADFRKFSAFSSGVPLWSPRFVAAQRTFAREFLGHVNPYTGKSYLEEPAVAWVEIINENGILCAWRGGHLRKAWPDAMVADLGQHWNAWLRTRYANNDRLRQAWATGAVAADPAQRLKNPAFAEGTSAWAFQLVKPSAGRMEAASAGGPQGQPCLTLTTERAPAAGAFALLHQGGLTIARKMGYQLSFWAKADEPADAAQRGPLKLGVSVTMNHAPWSAVGLVGSVDVDAQWRQHTLFFVGSHDETNAKLMLSPPVGSSRLSLTDFSLTETAVVGLPDAETLEAGNVDFPLTTDECVRRTPRVARDFVDFLYDVDRAYFRGMYAFVREELGCRHPIKGTQVDQYSSYFSQAACDFVDAHGYWQHPNFPRKPWDPNDWTIGNSPMVSAGGTTVVGLAGCRVRGKPYNVSEYCHPAPSTYCGEQIPTVAAFGALQDWDGITFHCWQELAYDWRRKELLKLAPDRLDSYFNIARHPVKLVTIPFGTLAFRRGDMASAAQELAIGVTLDDEKDWLVGLAGSGRAWRSFQVAGLKGATWRDAFAHRLSLNLGARDVPAFAAPDEVQATSDTGQLHYDLRDPAAGVLTVNAPRAKAVIGFGAGKDFALGDVRIQPGPTMQDGYSVITASAVQGEDFRTPGARVLVTATGYVENQGMEWNAEKTSVGTRWGAGPVLCEGIVFDLSVPAKQARAWALDGRGRRVAEVPAVAQAQGVQFRFGPQYKTLWYEIAVP